MVVLYLQARGNSNMKKRLAVIVLVVALCVGFAAEEKARANSAVSFNLFYSSLAPYGNWVPMDYGYAWAPTGVGAGWRPYMDGQWVWSDLGWTWSSYEPWGWATYHYGRWVMDPAYGWLWIPGTTWAPAWVSWYQTPGYVGWSPLPPDNNFFISIGFSSGYYGGYGGGYYGGYGGGYYPGYYGGGNYFSFNYYDYGHRHGKHGKHHGKGHYYDNDYYAPGEHCVFVPEDKFGYKNSKLVAVDIDKNRDLVTNRNIRNVTNIQVDDKGKVHNLGPDRTVLETSGRAKIERVSLVDTDLATLKDRDTRGRSANEDGKFAVYRPNIERKEGENPFSAEPVHNPARGDRNNNGTGTDRASLDRGSLNPGQNNLRPGSRNGDDFTTGGVRNPVDSGALDNSAGPGEHGVIRRNGSRNGSPENQRLGSMPNERPGAPSNGLAPNNNGAIRPQRGNVDTGRPGAPTISRPQNSGPVMNRPSANRPQDFGPGQGPVSRPEINRPSGQSMNRPSADRPQNYAPAMNRPSNDRPQMNERQQGPGSRSMMSPNSYAPDAGRPSMNRQQSYSPQRMGAPSQGRQGNAPSMNRQGGPSRMRAPERQSAPAVRNINAPAPRQSYDRGGSRQGGQSVQPRSNNSRPSGNVRNGGGGGGSRQSYDRGSSSRSSGGSVRSAPSSSRGGSGGQSFGGSSIRGR
jgi:hypothetical protein